MYLQVPLHACSILAFLHAHAQLIYTPNMGKTYCFQRIAERVVNMHTLGDEFLNPSKEIMYLNAVKHDNVLSMYGFCFHATGSCLIYQYMANGSLEDRLQRKVRFHKVFLTANSALMALFKTFKKYI